MIKPPKNYNPRTEWKLLLAIALTVAAWHLTSDITNAMDDKIERDEEWLRLVANLDYPSDCPLCDDQYFEVSSFWGQKSLDELVSHLETESEWTIIKELLSGTSDDPNLLPDQEQIELGMLFEDATYLSTKSDQLAAMIADQKLSE